MSSYADMQDHSVPSVLLGGDLSETMLNSLKRRSDTSDTGRWLTSLVDHAMDLAANSDSEQPITRAPI